MTDDELRRLEREWLHPRRRVIPPPILDGSAPLPSADIESTRAVVPMVDILRDRARRVEAAKAGHAARFRRCRCGGALYTYCGRVLGAGVAAAMAVGVGLGMLVR